MDPTDLAAFNNLTDDLTAVIIVLVAVLGPVWLLTRYLKYKSARNLPPRETELLEQMTRIAQRMDSRMTSVERILDAESPSWRNQGRDEGERYERHAG